MQAAADWRKTMTADQFTAELGVEFRGPGFYLTKGDTLLVVPQPPDKAPTKHSIWKRQQPAGTIYDVHTFNCTFSQTVFSVMSTAPKRLDDR